MLVSRLRSRISTVSPSRTRSMGPGTLPPKVQKVYSTPLASVPFSSVVSRSTSTRAGRVRSMAGGTIGGLSSAAFASVAESARCAFCAATAPAIRPRTATAAITPRGRFMVVVLLEPTLAGRTATPL